MLVLFTYPSLVTITITSSLGIITVVSILISVISSFISVSLGLWYSFLTLRNSSFITLRSTSSSSKISCKLDTSSLRFLNSSSSKVTSVLVNLYNCKVTIASACSSVNWNSLTKLTLASLLFLLARITLITSSKIERHFISPSTIWRRAFAVSKSKLVRLVITSFWNLI